MPKIAIGTAREIVQPDCIQALIVEFIVTFLFMFVGVGSVITVGAIPGNPLVGVLFAALAHAFIVVVMIGAGLRFSAGHLNPAVTVGLCFGGYITVFRSFLYLIDQLLAAVAACALLKYLTGASTVPVQILGAGTDYLQGVIMEIVLTFSLLFVVYATLVDPKKGSLDGHGALITGLLVGANIMAGAVFSGAAMNPARAFGPAFVSGDWTDHWVYWVGPLIGGGLSGFIYENVFIAGTYVAVPRDEEY